MQRRIVPLFAVMVVSVAALCAQVSGAQAPASAGRAGTGAATAQARRTQGSAPANVQQLMRGILFPNSNVIFAAQSDDPEKVEKAQDPATATDPLKGVYGGWEAVMNAGLALTESARLLEVPRNCSNGKAAPIASAVWRQGVTQLRAAGLASYEAGKAKDQDKVLDAADKVVTACSTCHDKFREATPRCTP